MIQSLQIDVKKALLDAHEAFRDAFDASISHASDYFREKMRNKTMVPSRSYPKTSFINKSEQVRLTNP